MKRFSDSRSSRCCLALILLFFFNVGTSTADSTPEYTLQCEGIVRTYRLHIPDELPENAPLVIVLHGYGNPRPGVLNETADRHRFAVCYPQGEKDNRGKACWNVGYPFQQDMTIDDVEFLSQLVHHLQLKHGFSKRNVFCVGMSNGGLRRVEGNINLKQGIILGEKAYVEGNMESDYIILFGNIKGNIKSKEIILKSTGNVQEDIVTDALEIEMGSRYNGNLKISQVETEGGVVYPDVDTDVESLPVLENE